MLQKYNINKKMYKLHIKFTFNFKYWDKNAALLVLIITK